MPELNEQTSLFHVFPENFHLKTISHFLPSKTEPHFYE